MEEGRHQSIQIAGAYYNLKYETHYVSSIIYCTYCSGEGSVFRHFLMKMYKQKPSRQYHFLETYGKATDS